MSPPQDIMNDVSRQVNHILNSTLIKNKTDRGINRRMPSALVAHDDWWDHIIKYNGQKDKRYEYSSTKTKRHLLLPFRLHEFPSTAK